MSESGAAGQVPEPVPAWLLASATKIGLTEADLLAIRDHPPEGLEPPPDHSEEILLRFLAPALGEAYDAGRIDADRVAIYVAETMAFPAAVVAAAVEVSLEAAPAIPLDELGDALADLLDDLDELDQQGGLVPVTDLDNSHDLHDLHDLDRAHHHALPDAAPAAPADLWAPELVAPELVAPELVTPAAPVTAHDDPAAVSGADDHSADDHSADDHVGPCPGTRPDHDAPPTSTPAATAPTPTTPTPTTPTPTAGRRAKPGVRLPPRVLVTPATPSGPGSPSLTSSNSSWREPRPPNPPYRADPTRGPGLSSPRPPARAPPAPFARDDRAPPGPRRSHHDTRHPGRSITPPTPAPTRPTGQSTSAPG